MVQDQAGDRPHVKSRKCHHSPNQQESFAARYRSDRASREPGDAAAGTGIAAVDEGKEPNLELGDLDASACSDSREVGSRKHRLGSASTAEDRKGKQELDWIHHMLDRRTAHYRQSRRHMTPAPA